MLPEGLPDETLRRIMIDNPLETYPRLREEGEIGDNAESEGDGPMNVTVRQRTASQRLAIVDCDIHPALRAPSDLHPFLPERWREHMKTFGEHVRHGLTGQLPYPRMMAAGMRADAFPEQRAAGQRPRPDARASISTHNGVEIGMLMPLSRAGMEERNLDFAAALAHAVNDWQAQAWVRQEPRLRAGIVVPQEDAAFAVQEIEERAADPAFVQILLSPRSSDPLGHRRYWPIYAAAERARRPIGLHVQGYSGGHASTGSGWPTYYLQEHYAMCGNMQATVVSLVFEGVFERFPGLKIVLIEGGFAWVPALCWRMDKHWERMRQETPLRAAPAVRICARALLVHHAADRGAGEPARPRRDHGMGRVRPADVLDRLSALGLRRSAARLQVPAERSAAQRRLFRDNAKALYAL